MFIVKLQGNMKLKSMSSSRILQFSGIKVCRTMFCVDEWFRRNFDFSLRRTSKIPSIDLIMSSWIRLQVLGESILH